MSARIRQELATTGAASGYFIGWMWRFSPPAWFCSVMKRLALWLCAPARALDDEGPLRAMRSAVGRPKVARILMTIAHGVYLQEEPEKLIARGGTVLPT